MRKNIEEEDAKTIVEQKKTDPFRSLLSRPKKEDIHLHSIKLYYECSLMVSGRYTADYFRKATHSISVDSNVHEVVFGDGVFPIRSKSGLEKVVGTRGKNKVDLQLEEHVFIQEEDELTFDHHGREADLPFQIDSEIVENYPTRVLEQNQTNIKKPELTHDAAIDKLKLHLKKPLEADIRNLNDEFVLNHVTEVYVPVFEARLVDLKKKVGIIGIDAVRKKTI